MNQTIPLAEHLRPLNFDDYIGQEHLVGNKSIFRKVLDSGIVPSMILWGPPGVGKTTLASIIALHSKKQIFTLSAISSGVKDVRDVITVAKENRNSPILFIDEIHRFSKSQQDSLLSAVEKGIVILIGATTENPSFEVISPLLSRCQVYILKTLDEKDMLQLLNKAKDYYFKLEKRNIIFTETEALYSISGGDARKLYNAIELIINSSADEKIEITDQMVMDIIQKNLILYDKNGEQHYDVISAFIKSMRGSDPNATVYWLARMVESGEDPKFIARRMLILASEDIGNANPNALLLANNCFQAINVIGYPECELILSQTAIYLACSPKSNASYKAIKKAHLLLEKTGHQPVPLHLRNAPTKLMKNIGYGKDYKYAHDYDNNFVEQDFLPNKLKGSIFYEPQDNQRENEIRSYLKNIWKNKYKY